MVKHARIRMDEPRGIIAGTLSVLALVGIIALQAIGKLDAATLAILSSLATGGMTYAVGLYSEPRA
jgi:hypothetical protein